MTASSDQVVVVGSINVDQVVTVDRLPRPGETLIGSTMTLLPGGKGANQAVAAARRGAPTVMIGAVGDDAHASTALRLLVESGADTTRVETVAGPTGLAVVSVGADSENTIVVIPGANASVGPEVIDRHAEVLAAAAVVVLQGEIPVPGIERAVRLATGRVLLNLAPVVAVDPGAVRSADPLVVNEHEARLLLEAWSSSGGGRSDGAAATGLDDESVVTSLRAHGVASVVLTRGAAGAVVSDDSGVHIVPSPRVTAVDSSGAGDAFVGALAAALASGATLLDATRGAVRVGAFSVTGSGTQTSYPTLADALPGIEAAQGHGEVRS